MQIHLPQWTLIRRWPVLSNYGRSRGKSFLLAWFHRISGLIIIIFLIIHMQTLRSLSVPAAYAEKMQLLRFFGFILLEWCLAFPVIFHALNGGRLILYESYGVRRDVVLRRWVWVGTLLYVGLLGVSMAVGGQSVSAPFYWLWMLSLAVIVSIVLGAKVWKTAHTLGWRIQRISSAFLLVMVPAHFLFMHLSPVVSHDVETVLTRLNNVFIKGVDCLLVVAVLYHAGYGLSSIIGDYVGSRWIRSIASALVAFFFGLLALRGITLTILL